MYELTKRTHEKNVRRLGTIIQSIFCAQSGASIHLTVWKWSGESRYPGALPPVLENFRRAFSPGPTDCPWVSEDVSIQAKLSKVWKQRQIVQKSVPRKVSGVDKTRNMEHSGTSRNMKKKIIIIFMKINRSNNNNNKIIFIKINNNVK